MKILHIRFCNLNSLAGSWSIDLTAPEYIADGIFAITGPTGSGKTTILDAVCLALYGQTPRLKQVSKSTNEIMTRQTGECWSEVEFSTSKGRYRCHWSQHRARKSSGGELQQPRHEIIDCATSQPLETKIKQVALKVVEMTGMNFQQFTRSILLAQGEFNSFLKADPDERAPILEQITGTDIYSRISRKVHERKGEEFQLLQQLTKECDGFTPLNADRLGEIATRLQELTLLSETSEKNITQSLSLLDWYTNLDKLKKDIQRKTDQLAIQMQHWETMEPERQRLSRADKAKLLEPDYIRLTELRVLQEREQSELADSVSSCKQIDKDLHEATASSAKAIEQLCAIKREVKEQDIVLLQVRALDQQLKNLQDQQTEQAAEHAKELQGKFDLEKSCHQLTTQLQSIDEQLQKLTGYRQTRSQDKMLIEDFSGIRQQLEHSIQQKEKLAAISTQIPVLKKGIIHVQSQVTAKKLLSSSLTASLQRLALDNATTTQQLAELLNGQPTEQLYTRDSHAQEQLYTIEQATAHIGQLARLTTDQTTLAAEEHELTKQIEALQSNIQRAKIECHHRKEAVDKQQQIVLLANRIKDLEQHRELLRDNAPCPLCGSLTHPYSTNTQPESTEEHTKLEADIALLDSTREALTTLQTTLATIQTKRDQLFRTQKDNEHNRQERVTALSTLCQKIGLQPDQLLEDTLARRTIELTREREQLGITRQKIENLKAQQAKEETTRNSLNHESVTTERELQKLVHDREKLETQLQQRVSEQLQMEQDLATRHNQLLLQLAPYTQQQITPEEYTIIIEQLALRRTLWLQNEEQYQVLTLQLQETRANQTSQSLLLERQQKICTEHELRLTRVTDSLIQLSEQRLQLFGDLDPDRARQLLHERLENAEKVVTDLNLHQSSLQQKHAALIERVDALEKRISARTLHLHELATAFRTALTEVGFPDEEDFRNSCMDLSRYKHVSESIHQQQKAIDESKALLKSSTLMLSEEQNKNLTDTSPADISIVLTEQRELHTALQQETGALKQQLRDNEQQRQRHAAKLEQLTRQKIEVERWSRLHELIGSSDGKKFRNFAQGLTFEIMISHANTSLQKMSDRYLLVRDPTQPLELHVIDNYQGGEIRSTKNLSGGESFIVSMALALGLSGMASHNVQVDSLFLDEGFGTLDDEALQTALDTLAGLHQEGKIIGIISHVSGLQDRITTQIRVSRGLGGLSSISGPGTSRWKGLDT